MTLQDSAPGQQDPLILLQLLHEGGVWLCDVTLLFNIVKGRVQVPAVLLHSVGDDGGGRATHAHLTVNQTLSTSLPEEHRQHRNRVALHE